MRYYRLPCIVLLFKNAMLLISRMITIAGKAEKSRLPTDISNGIVEIQGRQVLALFKNGQPGHSYTLKHCVPLQVIAEKVNLRRPRTITRHGDGKENTRQLPPQRSSVKYSDHGIKPVASTYQFDPCCLFSMTASIRLRYAGVCCLNVEYKHLCISRLSNRYCIPVLGLTP